MNKKKSSVSEQYAYTYCLYRLLDFLNAVFSADNPFRQELETHVHAMLDDLEKDDLPF